MQSYILCEILVLLAFCGNLSASSSTNFESEVRLKILEFFPNAVESTRLLFYLDQEKKEYKDFLENAPAWRTLKTILESSKFNSKSHQEDVFKNYAQFMIEDTMKARNNKIFLETMSLMYAEMLDASDDPLASDAHRGFSKVGSGSNFIITSMGVLSNENKAEYLQSISKYFTNNRKITSLAKKVDSNSMVALASVQLSIDAIRNINLWWNGKISGERCTKTIVDAAITVGGGIGGCALGSAVGSYFGPIGSNIGSYVGGLLGTQFASIISDRLTQEIFGLPKDVALENAYIYFGVPITASNTEINAAYRALCRKHHPDKGGKSGEFELVQAHMTLIKNARESL